MKHKFILLFLTILLVASFAGTPITASAQEAAQTKDWQFAIELYAWGASIGGKSARGSDIDVELDDIFDSLEFAFMGAVGARKGKWTFAADVMYLDADKSATIRPRLTAMADVTTWIVTPVVGYNLADTGKSRLDIVGGARYLYLKAALRTEALKVRTAGDSGSNWDAIIGARGEVGFAKNWHLFGYLDIGTGESDLTWQAMAGIGYKFKWIHLNAAYRYLEWEFDDNPVLDKLDVSGPALGIKFVF